MSKRTIGPVVVPAERRCIACETASSSNTKYCGECGHQLAGTAASAVRPLGLPMARRTSRCERKRVTVLFTDVSGFTAMSERLDNEYLFAMMEQAFEVILDQVHRCGGSVNQFLGDGVMALFGESGEQNHAQRALSAALAIQEGLEPLRAEVRRAHGIEFQLRITINSGDVALGTIGDSLRTDYAAAGPTVNVAAQLLRVARPGEIVITDHTRRLAADVFLAEDLGDISVTGFIGPTHVYSVRGWNPRSVVALQCA